MKILFVHQSFPGQFKNIARTLAADPANDVRFISRPNSNAIEGVRRVEYTPIRSVSPQVHHYVRDLEGAVLNGQTVARKIMDLVSDGFVPDIVVGHNGWGDTLFIKDVLPSTPLLSYFEFYYRVYGADTHFDPEFPLAFDDSLRIRMKNTTNLVGLEAADHGLTATRWQHSLYPAWARKKITVLHEGIDTAAVSPAADAAFRLPNGRTLSPGARVVTYVARNLEPYRGIHSFMRSLPRLLDRDRETIVVVVGGSGVSYGRPASKGDTHLARMMKEISLDWERVWFFGQVPYEDYLALLRVSAAHVYLTYPFVLSWSMLEAMSAGCLVVGSATPPVQELIRDGDNGLLVDFFSPDQLADRLSWALDNPSKAKALRRRARETIVQGYDYESKVKAQYLALLDRLISPSPRRRSRRKTRVSSARDAT